jgi:hypothetical protein
MKRSQTTCGSSNISKNEKTKVGKMSWERANYMLAAAVGLAATIALAVDVCVFYWKKAHTNKKWK